MVDSMTDIDLATVHPRAPAGPPGTEVPGAIFRYWNTEDGPRYGAQRCRRSTPGTPGTPGTPAPSQDADPRNERSATARQTQVWLLVIVVLAGLGGVFKRDWRGEVIGPRRQCR